MFSIINKGRYFDFRDIVEGANLTPEQITIIESNLNTQLNIRIGWTKLTWDESSSIPQLIKVEKYEDKTEVVKLFTTTLTWVGTILDTVTIINEDDNVTDVVTLIFSNGLLRTVEKL